MVEIDDKLAHGLKLVIGHGPPFSDDELARVETLTVTCPSSIDGIGHCVNLRSVELFAGDFTTLAALAGLRKLARLQIACSRLQSLAGVDKFDALETLTVNFTLCTDASPLAGLASSIELSAVGNPWDDKSWKALSARRGARLSPESHYRLTRRLHDAGLPLVFGAIEGQRPALIRPGVGIEYMVDLAELDEAEVERALKTWKPGSDVDEFFYTIERPREVEMARPERFWKTG